ncbi:MAG: inositol monophosphatase, partial [Gemmatimonadetes bacterium]|nr:inositol monophosphatase [Gemmatimonadota bacterium]
PGHALLAEEAAGEAASYQARPLFVASADDPETGPAGVLDVQAGSGDANVIEWIVDPLDGTKNFIHGYPAYAVSVAARAPQGIVAGAVYDPLRDEMFSAALDQGATLNGHPIQVSSALDPSLALVATGFPFRHSALAEPYLESFRRVSGIVSDIRRGGSAALDLAYVACGRLDGYWELALSPWDIAAGLLLVEEARGTITDDDGGHRLFERGHVIAGGVAIHAVLLEVARASFGRRLDDFVRTGASSA